MGLHAQIHQAGREVCIALAGEFRAPEIAQLSAILTHFQGRGCQRFVLDLSHMAPLSPAAEATLNRLIGQTGTSAERTLRGSAIRLLADSPAAQPQTGCGGLIFSAAS
jgi:hypothetical protein